MEFTSTFLILIAKGNDQPQFISQIPPCQVIAVNWPFKAFSVPSRVLLLRRTLLTHTFPLLMSCIEIICFTAAVSKYTGRSATSSSIKVTVCLSGVSNDLAVLSGKYWICPPLYDAVAQLVLIWRRLFDVQTALPSSLNGLIVHDYTKFTGLLTSI